VTLLEALNGPRVLVMDGAMGTALLAAGVRSVNAAPLTHPEVVREVHASHVAAGAEVVLTCTFQCNPVALAREGLLRQRERLYERAIELACSAGAPFVVVDIGPTYSPDAAGEAFDREALGWGLAGYRHVHGYLLETWSSPAALAAANYLAVMPITAISGRSVLLSLAYHRDANGALVTRSGHPPEYFAREARRHGVAALGVNCGRDIGLRDVIEILRRYREETDLPLFARPNAGTPGPDGAYPLTPEALALAVPEMIAAGARMIGGCCGTTAAHIKVIAGCRPQIAD
jgi:5-methyltetrahydrofolate--homocysteine methyltransferase